MNDSDNMDDLDFANPPAAKPAITPAAKPTVSHYSPKIALSFFQLAGLAEQCVAGSKIFAEQDKSTGIFSKGARVYLLLEGEVALTRNGKPLNLVMPGEVFGELAVISDAPRSATATARKPCKLLSLDEKRFVASLQKMPDFALMLLGMMAERLQHSIGRALAGHGGPIPVGENANVLDKRMLADLQRAMGNPTAKRAVAGDVLLSKGGLGIYMFVVTSGCITISVGETVVERVGAGGTFGELALISNASRLATAVADVDSALFPVTREDFLVVVSTAPAFGIALLRSMSERLQHISAHIGG